jgi:hypothetical protein
VVEMTWEEARERVRAGAIDEMQAVAAFYMAAEAMGRL